MGLYDDDAGFQQYLKDNGIKLDSEPTAPKNGSIIGDTATGLKRGVEQLPGMVAGLADIPAGLAGFDRPVSRAADWVGEKTGFQPGKWADEARDQYSQALQEANKNVADTKGFWNSVGAYIENPRAIANQVAESLPSTIATGGVGRGLMTGVMGAEKLAAARAGLASTDVAVQDAARMALLKSGATAGGIGEGLTTAGQQMQQTSYDVDPTRAAATATMAGIGTGIIGKYSGDLARKMGIEDLETDIAAGVMRNGKSKGAAGYAKGVAAGALTEGALEELPQSMQEQIWQNVANGKEWHEGVSEAGAAGFITGAAMGAGANLRPQGRPDQQQKPLSDENQPTSLLGHNPEIGTSWNNTYNYNPIIAEGSESQVPLERLDMLQGRRDVTEARDMMHADMSDTAADERYGMTSFDVNDQSLPDPTDPGSAIAVLQVLSHAAQNGQAIIEGSRAHEVLLEAQKLLSENGLSYIAQRAPEVAPKSGTTQVAETPAAGAAPKSQMSRNLDTSIAEHIAAGTLAADSPIVQEWNASKKQAKDATAVGKKLVAHLSSAAEPAAAETTTPAVPNTNPVPVATQEVAPVKLQAKDLTAKQRPLYDYMQTAIDTDNIGELVDAQGVFKYSEIGDKLGIARGSAKSFVEQIAKKLAKKNGMTVDTMKEMLKARVAAIRTTESHDDDRLGLAPDQQAQVANETDYLGGEGGAEQSMGLISSVGGSQGETEGLRHGHGNLNEEELRILRTADRTKNDVQPDAVQTAAENEFAQRRAEQARAEADAAFDAVLAHPEAKNAAVDFADTFETNWGSLTKPEQAEFVMSYVHAISEYDTFAEAEAALKKEFSHYGRTTEEHGSAGVQDTQGLESQPRLENVQGESGSTGESKSPVVTTKKRRVVKREEVTKFSKGEGEQGTTTGAIQSAIADIAPKGSLKVRVVQSVDDLTPTERAAAEADAGQSLSMDQWGQVQAFVVNGKAYFIADNIPAGAERAVFLHEVGSHLGLEKLLSKQQFNQLVGKLKAWAAKNDNSQESQLAKAALDRVESAGTVSEDQDAELVAYFIEESVKAGINPTATKYSSELQRWFRTFWAAFKSAVRRMGMNSDKFTPQDVVDMAYGAARLELNGTWHGTAADFRNFNHEYMGSGEGAQAFGWGTYLAQRVGIAKGYWKDDVRRKGATVKAAVRGKALADQPPEVVAMYERFKTVNGGTWFFPAGLASQRQVDEGSKFASDFNIALSMLLPTERNEVLGASSDPEGSLMRVDTAVHDDEMLDWDKPLSEQNKVRIALMPLRKFLAHTADELSGDANWNALTGEEMYRLVQRALQQDYFDPNLQGVDEALRQGKTDKAASEYLDSIGIKGIKFLDSQSRNGNGLNAIQQIRLNSAKRDIESKSKMVDEWENDLKVAEDKVASGNRFATVIVEHLQEFIADYKKDIAEAQATIDRLESTASNQTRNLVIFNDKNIQRVATQVGADRQRVKFSIQSPTMRKTSGLVKQLLEVASDKSKSMQYAMMFGHQFSELAEKIIPGAKQYFASLNEKQRERVKQEEAIASIATNHYALKQSEQNAVNRMIDRATSQEAWPFKPEWIPEAKVDAQLGSEFNAMSPESQQVVKDVFKFGSEQQKRFDESINDLMPEGQKINRKQMMGVPYAPLKRFGDHVVIGKSAAYKAEEAELDKQKLPTSAKLDAMKSDPAHYHVEFVDGDFEAVTRRDALAEANPTMAWDKKPLQVEHRDLNAMSFTMLERLKNSISDVDKTQGATKAALEALANQLYVAQLNHLHANKSQQTRKGVKGYDQDMMRAFVSQGRSEASLIASLKTHSATEASLQKVKTAARQGGQQDNKTRIANEILRRHVAMLNYKETPIQNKLLATNSLYFLLTSPAYYLTNATQPFVLSLPVMTATHGSKAWGAMTSAYKQAFDAIKLFKNTNLDETALKTFDSVGNESGAVKALLDENLVNIGMEMELGDIVDSGGGKVTKAFKGGMKFMRTTVANVETLNRLSTAVAAYRLAYTEALNQGKTKDEAHTAGTLYARDVIIKTHGDYAGYNAPSIMMQGAYGTLPVKVLMQFKKFQFIQAGLLLGAFKQSINGATPEEKAVARKTLAYVLGTQMALAGSLGIPLMGTAAAALAAMGADDGEDKEAYLRRLIGNKTIAQLLLHGAPAAAGVDMSKRIGMGNVFSPLPFVDDTGSNKDKAKNLIVGVAGPSASLFLRGAQGVDQMQKGQYWKGLESLLPNGAVTNLSKVARFENQGVTNNRGDVVMKPEEVGFFDDVTQALGLPSTTLTDRSWKASVDYDRKKHLQGEADALKRDYIEARKSGDSTAEIMQKWNKLQVERMKQGFTRQSMSNLVGAPNEQMKRERHTIGGIPYGKSDKKFVQNLDAL